MPLQLSLLFWALLKLIIFFQRLLLQTWPRLITMEVFTSCLCGFYELVVKYIFRPPLAHKYRNLQARPHASVMIDISRSGLDLRGVMIKGRVELLNGELARQLNHTIHSKYVTPEGLNDFEVASYLSKGDDITIKVHMDHLISWNLSNSKTGKPLNTGGWFHPLDE